MRNDELDGRCDLDFPRREVTEVVMIIDIGTGERGLVAVTTRKNDRHDCGMNLASEGKELIFLLPDHSHQLLCHVHVLRGTVLSRTISCI